jgi:regulator of protease activity HflC (stomatin/prohibitin superfamily)
MATISKLGPLRHLRAEPNQYVLHYQGGRVVTRGAGIAYWFNPLSAAIAQVPGEDCEITFSLVERTADFQDVTVQCTLTWRFSDPEAAAARFNFTISLATGAWTDQPLERLANVWSQRAQKPLRLYISQVPVVDAITQGAEVVRSAIEQTLREDPEIAAMGMAVVNVQVTRVMPTSEVEKALQTPTRESIQQRADEATFSRRANAVEKERAIKENELATEIELARKQEQLIRQQGANKLLDVRQQAETERARVDAELARQALVNEAYARDVIARATGDAEARRMISHVDNQAEATRVGLWTETPGHVALGISAMAFAQKIQNINHLNLTPDLVGQALQALVTERADR